jgi:hypothetical protein
MHNGTFRHMLGLVFVFQLACSEQEESIGGSCSAHSDCVLVSRDCCGGEAESLANVYATRRDSDDALHGAPSCRGKTDNCPYYDQPVFDPLGPNVRASCVAAQCTAIDVRKDEASACAQDSDCRAEGAGCCPACQRLNLGSYVALSAHADPTLLACFPIPPCDTCVAADLPSSYCAADGHCALRD